MAHGRCPWFIAFSLSGKEEKGPVSEDELFLIQIFEHPEDTALRLVYADWLEDRGDARGELIRARAQRADLSAKDRQRKKVQQREHELAAQCDPDWLVLLERAD
jgi:uncharacterized protein (TIGR02996 family)